MEVFTQIAQQMQWVVVDSSEVTNTILAEKINQTSNNYIWKDSQEVPINREGLCSQQQIGAVVVTQRQEIQLVLHCHLTIKVAV